MNHIRHTRKSLVLLAVVSALGAPTVASAYPIIGDDPGSIGDVGQGHTWYVDRVKRLAQLVKPDVKTTTTKPARDCPTHGKVACLR
jgi:hypothetical protein